MRLTWPGSAAKGSRDAEYLQLRIFLPKFPYMDNRGLQGILQGPYQQELSFLGWLTLFVSIKGLNAW